jgi:hypothetical protein
MNENAAIEGQHLYGVRIVELNANYARDMTQIFPFSGISINSRDEVETMAVYLFSIR